MLRPSSGPTAASSNNGDQAPACRNVPIPRRWLPSPQQPNIRHCASSTDHTVGRCDCVDPFAVRAALHVDGYDFSAAGGQGSTQTALVQEAEIAAQRGVRRNDHVENGAQYIGATPNRMVPLPAFVDGVPMTTLLVRNVWHRLLQEQVLRQWPYDVYNYDLLYLCYDMSKKRCAGHLFINFLTYESAAEFWVTWNGTPCPALSSTDTDGEYRALEIEVAQRQGFWPNVAYWQGTLRRHVSAALLPAVWVNGQRQNFWRCRSASSVSAGHFFNEGQAGLISL